MTDANSFYTVSSQRSQTTTMWSRDLSRDLDVWYSQASPPCTDHAHPYLGIQIQHPPASFKAKTAATATKQIPSAHERSCSCIIQIICFRLFCINPPPSQQNQNGATRRARQRAELYLSSTTPLLANTHSREHRASRRAPSCTGSSGIQAYGCRLSPEHAAVGSAYRAAEPSETRAACRWEISLVWRLLQRMCDECVDKLAADRIIAER